MPHAPQETARPAIATRRLGLPAALAMVVTQVVGVGIFLSPATMIRTLGDPWAALTVWAVMGLLTAAGALCYAELTTRFPKAGGAYVFLREAFGTQAAFVYGWMSLLVVDPGITAALGIGLAQYLLAALGAPAGAVPLTALAVVALFGGLTLSGLRTSAHLLRWTAAAKFAIVFVLLAFAVRTATTAAVGPSGSGIALGPGGLAASAIAAFFAFGGWWDLGRMSEEVTTPARTLPRALLGGVAVVTALYMLLTVAFMLVVPATDLDSDEALVSMVGVVLFGEAAGRLLAVMVVVAVAGSLAAVLLSAPRVYLAMARDGIFPERLVRYDPARGTAAGATLIQVAVAAALVLLGTFDQILAYFVPGAVFFLGLSAAALIRLPRPAPGAVVFRVPGHPVPLLLFLILITGMLLLFAVGQPVQTLAGALVIAAGIPVSFFVTRHRPS